MPAASSAARFWVIDGSVQASRPHPGTLDLCSAFNDADEVFSGNANNAPVVVPPRRDVTASAVLPALGPCARLQRSGEVAARSHEPPSTSHDETTADPAAKSRPSVDASTELNQAAAVAASQRAPRTLCAGASFDLPAAALDTASNTVSEAELCAGPNSATLVWLPFTAWQALEQRSLHALPSAQALHDVIANSSDSMSASSCTALLHGSVLQRFAAGEQLLLAGDTVDTALLVLSGALALRYELPGAVHSGFENVAAKEVHAGTFVGAVAALHGEPLWASVHVTADTAVLAISKGALRAAAHLSSAEEQLEGLLDMIWVQEMHAREAAIGALARDPETPTTVCMDVGLAMLVERVAAGTLGAAEAAAAAPFAPLHPAVARDSAVVTAAVQQRCELAQVRAAQQALQLQAVPGMQQPAASAVCRQRMSSGVSAQAQQHNEKPPVSGSLMRQCAKAAADLADGKRRVVQTFDGASVTLGDDGQLHLHVPYSSRPLAAQRRSDQGSSDPGTKDIDFTSLHSHGRWQTPCNEAVEAHLWDPASPAARCMAELHAPQLAFCAIDAPESRAHFRTPNAHERAEGHASGAPEAPEVAVSPRLEQSWTGVWRAAKVRADGTTSLARCAETFVRM